MENMTTVMRMKTTDGYTVFFKQITSYFIKTNTHVILYRLDVMPTNKKFKDMTDDDVFISKRFTKDVANEFWYNLNRGISRDILFDGLYKHDLV